jgi:RNA polymerase sigma factor (sigma-70 family)
VNRLTDPQLLRDYTARRSEAAFTELVRRHVDLVYSAALRMVCDAHLAEDVTQGVFVALAQNARQLMEHPVLSGWLHRTTQNLASKAVRSDVRRRAHEQEAATMNELLSAEPDVVWEHIAPHLDTALGELGEADRDALLLRYFERKSASEMAQTLGISDEAAQKRVSRAVERLRDFFAKRGITVGASGLVTISTAVALAGTTIATTTTAAAAKTIAMTAIQKALLTTIVAALGTPLLMQHQSLAKLRTENESLRHQLTLTNNVPPPSPVAMVKPASTLTDDQLNELLRLRGQVGVLRRQVAETAKQQEKTVPPVSEPPPELSAAEQEKAAALQKQQFIAKMGYARNWTIAFLIYADKNGGQFPTNFNQAATLLPDQARDESVLATNQFDIFYSGSLSALTNNLGNIIIIGESQAQPVSGGWVKTYGFADGHSEVHKEADGNFEA